MESVMFRTFRKPADGGVIALLLERPSNCHNYYYCEGYTDGQFVEVDPNGIIRATRPAKPEEYAPLKKKLEFILGNIVSVKYRHTEQHLRSRQKKLQEWHKQSDKLLSDKLSKLLGEYSRGNGVDFQSALRDVLTDLRYFAEKNHLSFEQAASETPIIITNKREK